MGKVPAGWGGEVDEVGEIWFCIRGEVVVEVEIEVLVIFKGCGEGPGEIVESCGFGLFNVGRCA